MLPDRLSGARDEVRVGVDLVRQAGHSVNLPERAERDRVGRGGRAQLRVGDPAGVSGRRRWLRSAEHGMPERREPRLVDGGLIFVERHDMAGDQPVQGQRLRGRVFPYQRSLVPG